MSKSNKSGTMDKEIKQFQQENGNITYKTRDLIGALHVKIDKINDRLVSGDKQISSNTTWINAYKWIIGGICVVIGFMAF